MEVREFDGDPIGRHLTRLEPTQCLQHDARPETTDTLAAVHAAAVENDARFDSVHEVPLCPVCLDTGDPDASREDRSGVDCVMKELQLQDHGVRSVRIPRLLK